MSIGHWPSIIRHSVVGNEVVGVERHRLGIVVHDLEVKG